MPVWAHKPILPPGLKTALAFYSPQGNAFILRASRILDTYGAETDLRNKLSSNNQIIHVSQSNNGGMWANTSGTFPSGMPLCVLGVPVDKGLLPSLLLLLLFRATHNPEKFLHLVPYFDSILLNTCDLLPVFSNP